MKICGLIEKTLTDYPGHTACTVFTGGCNFRCPYCNRSDLWNEDAEEVISEADFFKFLEKQAELKVLDSVVITGGEPMIQPGLPDFIRHIKGYYGLKVKIDTNAGNITMIDEFLCEGMIDYISMDIKAGHTGYSRIAGTQISDDVIASIRGCLDLFEGKYEGLPLFPYEFRTTVVGGLHTEQDFREIGELLHGIKKYVLQYYLPCGNIPEAAKSFYTPSKEEMLKYKEIVAPYVGEVEIRETAQN